MPRSPVISTIPIFALLIAGTVLSAPREEIMIQSPVHGELHETRESEVTRNEESLHRLASVAKEPLPVANQSQTEKPTTLSPTTLQHEKVQFSDSESKDMLGTHVTPQDDDDLTSGKPLEDVLEDSNTTKSKHVRATTIFAPIEFPKVNTDVDIRMATDEWFRDLNKNLDKNNATNSNATNSNATNSSATNSSATNSNATNSNATNSNATNSNATNSNAKNSNATNPRTKKRKESKLWLLEMVTLPWTSRPPTRVPASGETPTTSMSRDVTTTDRTTTTETVTLVPGISHKETEELTTTTTDQPTSSSHSPAEMKLHEKKIPEPEGMPAGIAAVIAAISFAIIVVVAYVGLLVRKRCVEWRYGNRELLVNDFDAADMTNFEL